MTVKAIAWCASEPKTSLIAVPSCRGASARVRSGPYLKSCQLRFSQSLLDTRRKPRRSRDGALSAPRRTVGSTTGLSKFVYQHHDRYRRQIGTIPDHSLDGPCVVLGRSQVCGLGVFQSTKNDAFKCFVHGGAYPNRRKRPRRSSCVGAAGACSEPVFPRWGQPVLAGA